MRYYYSPETLELITGTVPASILNTLPFLTVKPPSVVTEDEYVLADPSTGTWTIHKQVDDRDPKEIRDDALRNLTHDFGDGRVIQVRPVEYAADEANIRNAIERMQRLNITEQPWRMADNTTHLVGVADLEAAIVSGQDQGAAIWQAYFEALA